MSDLPIDAAGRVYHLQVTREQLADRILIVGDPDRAPRIADEFFNSVECDVCNRGLRTITGVLREGGRRISIVTSGMGTPSTEIVLNELVVLNEIDPSTRMRREHFEPLTLVRVGTSGALQRNTELGTAIISRYAVGFDNAASFYELPYADEGCTVLERSTREVLDQVMDTSSRFYGKLSPYAAYADPSIVVALERAALEGGIAYEVGVTASAPGFFGAQGRDIGRVGVAVPDLDRHLSNASTGLEGQRFLNMEMEASFLLAFLAGQGYRAGVVCAAVANRAKDTFADNIPEAVAKACQVALRALVADVP